MAASASCELSASGLGGLAVAPVLDAKPDMAELEPDVAVLDRGGGRRVERGEDVADAAALLGVERREGRYRVERQGLLDRRVDAKELEAPGENGGEARLHALLEDRDRDLEDVGGQLVIGVELREGGLDRDNGGSVDVEDEQPQSAREEAIPRLVVGSRPERGLGVLEHEHRDQPVLREDAQQAVEAVETVDRLHAARVLRLERAEFGGHLEGDRAAAELASEPRCAGTPGRRVG